MREKEDFILSKARFACCALIAKGRKKVKGLPHTLVRTPSSNATLEIKSSSEMQAFRTPSG